MTTKLSTRLKDLMKIRGDLTEIDLVRRSKLPQPTVHHILSGATSRPHRKSLVKLATALNVTIPDLFSNQSIEAVVVGSQKANELQAVPLLSWAQACTWSAQQADHTEQTTSSEKVFTDANVSTQAFAVEVKDSSMETLFPHGSILVVDPQKNTHDKCYILVHLQGDNEALFKQLLMDGERRYIKSLNPQLDRFEPRELTAVDRIVGVVAQMRFNF